jgi:hypothetical protein
MASTHTLGNGATVKVRHPLAPLGLAIVTLGIYQLVWYYKINAELRSQGEDVNPGMALLAVSLGLVLIVPPLVSLYNTAERIRRVQERAGVNSTISPVLALVLLFIPLANMFQTAYMQSALNAAWERAAGVTTPPAVATTPAATAAPVAD